MRNKLAFCLLAVVLSTLTVQVQAISTEALKQGIPSLAPMLEQVTPAVVSIRVTKSMPESQNYYFNNQRLPEELRRFFDVQPENGPDFNSDQPRRPYATGAGSISSSCLISAVSPITGRTIGATSYGAMA